MSCLLLLDSKGRLLVHEAVFEVLDLPRGSSAAAPLQFDDGRVIVSRGVDGSLRSVEFLGYEGVNRLPEFLAYMRAAQDVALLASAHQNAMLCWRDVERSKEFALEVISDVEEVRPDTWPRIRSRVGDLIVKTLKSLQRIGSAKPSKLRRKKTSRRAAARAIPKASRSNLRWKAVPA